VNLYPVSERNHVKLLDHSLWGFCCWAWTTTPVKQHVNSQRGNQEWNWSFVVHRNKTTECRCPQGFWLKSNTWSISVHLIFVKPQSYAPISVCSVVGIYTMEKVFPLVFRWQGCLPNSFLHFYFFIFLFYNEPFWSNHHKRKKMKRKVKIKNLHTVGVSLWRCEASPLDHLYEWEGENFGQTTWDKMRCYWEHIGNMVGTQKLTPGP